MPISASTKAAISRKATIRRSACGLFVACCVWAAAAQAQGAPAAPALPTACAARDLQIVTLIEDYGQYQDVPAERLAMAAAAQMMARTACAQGRMEATMAIYDLIHPNVILAAIRR